MENLGRGFSWPLHKAELEIIFRKRTMLTNNLSVIWRMNGHGQLWGEAQFSHLPANCQGWPRSTAIVTAAADLVRRWRAHPASADSCRGPTIPKHPQTNGIAHPKSHPTSQTNTTQQSQRPHQQPSQNTPDYDDQWHCLSQHHNSTTQHRSKEHNTIITVAQQTTNNYPKTPPDSDAHLMGLATPRCSPNKSHPLNSL